MKRCDRLYHFFRVQLPIFMMFLTLFSCGKKDSNVPQVTLKGESNIYLVLNEPYIEQGATATDPEDGEISVVTEGEVNTALEGIYEITYTAYDEAGNRGSATRWVHVYNEASDLKGNYQAISIINTDTLLFKSVFSTSTTLNKRVWIEGYGMDSTAVVYADITDSQIIVPKQAFSSGSDTHYYSGLGSINTTDSVLITINYTDSTSLSIQNGNCRYIKHYLIN